tara:strand:- start:1716 stop:2753 length:1038 start_codon:yes stop_codon:yes gene_type:complete
MAYSTVDKSSGLMNTLKYTGDGSATQAQTGLGFQPDFNWTKATSLSESNAITDSVRGATQTMYSNLTSADSAISSNLKSFDADGFTMGSNGEVGQNSIIYTSWNWKGGTTSGLSGGTITPSSYSINTTSKFGIYQYTGTGSNGTIAHGLGVQPDVMFIKCISNDQQWNVYHKSGIASAGALVLNTTASNDTSSNFWNDTEPDATVFTIGTNGQLNTSGYTYIAYVWCDVKGFCKSGRYKGNGESANGTFIYTGFKPSFVLIKNADSTAAWNFNNNTLLGYNPSNYIFNPNSAGAQGTSYISDIYSNGFKPFNSADAEYNASGNNYVYLAVGQSFIGSNGVCGTAR